jgi:hypothetical protein
LYGYQIRRVAAKAMCMVVKTKGRVFAGQSGNWDRLGGGG